MNPHSSKITGGFWGRWQSVNARNAIFHQWDQLERSGCIDNFRILAENKPVFRRGWYFADSDAYKWLEAACLILSDFPDPKLEQLVREFISLIGRAQDGDGYLYTFNQIHFPGTRWANLQIEHELYCHGHLVEAGVSCAEWGGDRELLRIACKAADRMVEDFLGKGPRYTPGHEEIEIALLRLFETTGEGCYLSLARQFLENRGKSLSFAFDLVRQSVNNSNRLKIVAEKEASFRREHALAEEKQLPPSNRAKKPSNIKTRWVLSTLSGKFFQQHKPLARQIVPVGHAVRFAYLQTAAAMLDRISGGRKFLPALQKSWDQMISRRMYLTGGIGSLPMIEGFGRDFELDPAFAYAETCAALGSLFWNREMVRLTGDAKYSDLFEWQLYNAALVGMGLGGQTYFYNNPLESDGEIQRRAWYEVPCCPSNLSRTFARLNQEVVSINQGEISIYQYISSKHRVQIGQQDVTLEIDSQFPWSGEVEINIRKPPQSKTRLKLRKPSWATDFVISLNGEVLEEIATPLRQTLDPTQAGWFEFDRQWKDGDRLTLAFDFPVQVWLANGQVSKVRGKAALVCGPLIYCLESVDNPDVDIFKVILDLDTIESRFNPDLLGGCRIIKATSIEGQPLIFIPYFLWGNRGKSEMAVFVRLK